MSDEADRDKRRIDKLLDAWEREVEGEPGAEVLTLASKSVTMLLERRAKLLGLDAVQDGKAAERGAGEREANIVAAIRALPKASGER